MYLIEKYKPNTQKSLFHKDIVNHIRKWILNLENLISNNKIVQNVLLLYGPSGCGKTTTVEILFKSYNLIVYDVNEFKSNKKIEEIFINLLNINSKTLGNIDKWNQTNKKDKNNIIFIDNVEGSDVNIFDLIEYIHVKQNTNIPIIISCNLNSIKTYENDIKSKSNLTSIKINSPSLLELTKLVSEIDTNENLKLNKIQIKQIINLSKNDIRQLFFILNQWILIKDNFDNFINTIQLKNQDLDLVTKIYNIFDHTQNFNFNETFVLSNSEPITISNNIYQNYLTNIIDKQLHKNTSNNQKNTTNYEKTSNNLNILESICNISLQFSDSDGIQKKIFDDQQWDLYNEYTISSCVNPSYYINKLYHDDTFKIELDTYDNNINNFMYSPFKDVSFNYYNSLQEVKKKCYENYTNSYINNALKSNELLYNFNLINRLNIDNAFYITTIITCKINILTEYFDKNKKGKNISKKEKIDLYNKIQETTDPNCIIKQSLNFVSSFVIIYRLFTIDTDYIFINKTKKTDNFVLDCLEKIEIRLFKRFLNIFTITENNNLLKGYVEMTIKYKILSELLYTFDHTIKQESFFDRNIENLTLDLGKIWKL